MLQCSEVSQWRGMDEWQDSQPMETRCSRRAEGGMDGWTDEEVVT
jgi:hypothetical protein